MSKKIVRREVDLSNLPPLTEKQKAELAALAAQRQGVIDFSDIPPLTEKFWNNAVRGRFYKPVKTSTTVRIDSDVLAWLRAQGKGYQSRINAILRREMLSATDRVSRGRPLQVRRHRDEKGEIRVKYGDTLIATLRKHYGPSFASGFDDTDTLARALATIDEQSLSKLVRDHEGGHLVTVLAVA
jgi:uncharacterized protein (DUF4415 family)